MNKIIIYKLKCPVYVFFAVAALPVVSAWRSIAYYCLLFLQDETSINLKAMGIPAFPDIFIDDDSIFTRGWPKLKCFMGLFTLPDTDSDPNPGMTILNWVQ